MQIGCTPCYCFYKISPSEALTTGFHQDKPVSWHFSLGNFTSDSFSKAVFWSGCSRFIHPVHFEFKWSAIEQFNCQLLNPCVTWTNFIYDWYSFSKVQFHHQQILLDSGFFSGGFRELIKTPSSIFAKTHWPSTEFISSYKFTWWRHHYLSLHD